MLGLGGVRYEVGLPLRWWPGSGDEVSRAGSCLLNSGQATLTLRSVGRTLVRAIMAVFGYGRRPMADPESVRDARRELGRRLAALRRAAGLNQFGLAAAVNYTRSIVANVEVGRQNAPREFWSSCDDVLRAGGTLLEGHDDLRRLRANHLRTAMLKQSRIEGHWTATPGGAGDPNLRRGAAGDTLGADDLVRVAGTAWFGMLPSDLRDLPGAWTGANDLPATLGSAHLRALQRSIDLFEQWDHQFGGGLHRAAMAGQLGWACAAVRHASMTDELRRRWLATTAKLADLAGWAIFDAGAADGLAERYLLVGLNLAGEAGDMQQRAHTATSLSRVLTYHGRTREALEIIDLARLSWRRLPALGRVAVSIVEARAHAKMGDARACRLAVESCDADFAAAPPDEAGDPTWGYYADTGQVLGDAGHALFDVAVHSAEEDDAVTTIERLEDACRRHDPSMHRSRALTMLRIASLKARHHDQVGAVHATTLAVADAQHVVSRRVLDDLRALRAALKSSFPRPADGGAAEAVRRIDRVLIAGF